MPYELGVCAVGDPLLAVLQSKEVKKGKAKG
jgi:hypothetical protein